MGNVNESSMGKDLGVLSNEITYRKYLMERINLKKLYKKISVVDYNAMQAIMRLNERYEESEKIYLRDIAQELKQPIDRVSQMIEKLRDKGMIKWTHDGKGEKGTYIQITDRGVSVVEEQHEVLKRFYGRVMERYGKDKFVQMLNMISELEDIMNDESEKFE